MKKILYEGIINLNGTNIKYSLTNNYFDSENHPLSYLEFNSLIPKKPNAITDTGYKSHCFGMTTESVTELIKEDPEGVVKHWVETLLEEKKTKIRSFSFGEKPELKPELVTELSLF